MSHQYEVALVTGAGGAVGQFAVDECIEICHLVVAVDLPGRIPQRFINHPGIAVVEQDLTTREGFRELYDVAWEFGVDAIINTAAVVDIAQPWEVVAPINVGLVEDLFELGIDLQAKHFVQISSASIYSEPEDDSIPMTEDAELFWESPYEKSKVVSEQLLQEKVKEYRLSPMNVTVLRPSLIYGPRCRFLGASLAAIPVLLEQISQTVVGFKGGPKTNWVHCEDVARACVHCMTREDPEAFKVFNVCNTDAPGFGDVITEHLLAYNLVPIVKIPLPPPTVLKKFKPLLSMNFLYDSVVNPILEVIWSLFGESSSQILVKVDKEAVPYAFKNTIFSNEALLKTGFELKWPLSTGLRATMLWYARFGWI